MHNDAIEDKWYASAGGFINFLREAVAKEIVSSLRQPQRLLQVETALSRPVLSQALREFLGPELLDCLDVML